MGDLELAEYYYYESVKYLPNKEKANSNDLNLIGEIKRLKGRLQESIDLFLLAIERNKQEKSYTDLAMNYNNIGLAHLEKERID